MIRTNEICDHLPARAWRDFRNALTDLDNAVPESERLPKRISSIIVSSGGESFSDLQGFVLSSTVKNGFIYRSGQYTEPIMIFSGVPQDTAEPQRYYLVGEGGASSMYTDSNLRVALIWASAAYNQIDPSWLSEILMGSGISYMPREMFIELSEACEHGTDILYRGRPYPDLSVSRIEGWLESMGLTTAIEYLSYINDALNSTYQSEGVVRRLALEHGLIERA